MRQHWAVTVGASLCLPILLISYLIYERDSPAIVGPQTTIPKVFAGEEVVIEVPVRRDIDRDCSMRVNRDLVDSTHALRSLITSQDVSAQGMRDREKTSPGLLKMRMVVPANTPSGEAHVLSNDFFTCPRNPTTWFFPIAVNLDWTIHVKPAPTKTEIVNPVNDKPKGTPEDPVSVTIEPKAKP